MSPSVPRLPSMVGIKLKDEFEALSVKVLGTPIDTIITTEDRDLFSQAMAEIGEKCAQSASATTFVRQRQLDSPSLLGRPMPWVDLDLDLQRTRTIYGGFVQPLSRLVHKY